MKVDGHCHCGHITYEAEVDPDMVTICHCTDCQSLTGSAYRVSVRVPAGSFRLLSGTPKVYIKTAESGNKRAHSFCPECGSPVFGADPENTKVYMLRVGGLRQRAQLPPKKQIWCDSAVPWAMDIEDVPQVARQ